MKKIIRLCLLCFCLPVGLCSQNDDRTYIPNLTFLWETDTVLPTVESVIYDSLSGYVFTANIDGHFMKKDGRGSISKLKTDGSLVDANWIAGLDAPTGLCIHNRSLFTTDIDRVLEIDIPSGQLIKTITVEGAKALNDITVSADGTLYCSDTGGNQLFKIQDGIATVFIDSIDTPNGLIFLGNQLITTQWNPQRLSIINIKAKEVRTWVSDIPQIDGVEYMKGSGFFTASWGGMVHHVSFTGEKTVLLDTRAAKVQAPDICFIPEQNLLLVATFETNTVRAYKVSMVPQKIEPILLDKAALSGLGLKRVTSADDPDRVLFQKRLYRGKEISVYLVASETKTAQYEDYGIEEFIYVLNGRARLKPTPKGERFFYPGDFFIVPKGYAGEWETQGGETYYYELSVVANDRSTTINDEPTPVLMDKAKIAGIGLTPAEAKEETFIDLLHQGQDLSISTQSEKPNFRADFVCEQEQLIYIIAGCLTLEMEGEASASYCSGDFVVIPKGFVGSWKSEGHELFRTLRVMKTQ